MKRLNASSCSGANSLTHQILEDSLPSPTPAKQTKLTSDPIVEFETTTNMISSNSQPASTTEATVRSQLDTFNINDAPSFSRNNSAGDVSTAEESSLGSPKAASTDGKRKKKKKKSEEMLDWRNYNDREKKRMGTDSVTPRGGLRTGLYRSNENAKENESSQDARDSSSQFIPAPPTSLRPHRKICDGSTWSGESLPSISTTPSAVETGEAKEECGYGQPHDLSLNSNSQIDDAPIFGTKNNPVKGYLDIEGAILTNFGLPISFGSTKGTGMRKSESRSKSSSSERGALGLTYTYVPMTASIPVEWVNNSAAHAAVDEDSIVVSNENEGEGCCDDGLREMRMERRRGEKELPEHKEKFIDSHCHLDFIWERHPFTEIQSLRDKYNESFLPTFKGCIANFIRPSNFWYKEWIQKVAKDEQVLGTSWGIHPHHSGEVSHDNLKELKTYIIENRDLLKIVAIGECGIDLSGRNGVSLEKQLEVFKFQVEMAYELDLPIIIHCREGKGIDKDPEDVVLSVLKERPNHPVHRHCFTRDAKVAKKWMQTLHDCSFGFTPLVVNSEWFDHLPEKIIPIDRIHLETDAPYFRPLEYKCFNNLPSNVSLPSAAITVAIRISEITGYSVDDVIRRTRGCTERIYRLHTYL
ncbi:hypothetical protein PRIPAC_78030 [Pristionchus pacificus]|nr:hypothetical protein PRIPAC_78030 [Pristionchus pacificus]